ncbi:MAG: M12 family metallo-peptidase, partial [Pirellulales bacterium]
ASAEATGIAEILNQTTAVIRFQVVRDRAAARTYQLRSSERVQVATEANATVVLKDGRGERRIALTADGFYALRPDRTGLLDLQRIGTRVAAKQPDKPPAAPATVGPVAPQAAIGPVSPATAPPATGQPRAAATPAPARIAVKLLVDDDEPARRELWEKRLRDRLATASAVLKEAAGVEFYVARVETWDSDDTTKDFTMALREFEQEVDPGSARLAIGFTSQFELVVGRTHLGGTRGPLARQILIREWSHKLSETERMEVLVHEMGHVLGAVHSLDQHSVMRPILGDRQSRSAKFTIRFDEPNRKIMRLVGTELAATRLKSMADLSEPTKQTLRRAYTERAEAFPKDPGARECLARLEGR